MPGERLSSDWTDLFLAVAVGDLLRIEIESVRQKTSILVPTEMIQAPREVSLFPRMPHAANTSRRPTKIEVPMRPLTGSLL